MAGWSLRLKLEYWRLTLGIIVSGILLFLLLYVTTLVSRQTTGASPYLSQTMRYFFTGLPLAAAVGLSLLAGLGIALGSTKLSGPLKVAQGVSAAFYFYLILGGGALALNFASGQVQAKIQVGLSISLILLEASALFRVFQGLQEILVARKTTQPIANAAQVRADKMNGA